MGKNCRYRRPITDRSIWNSYVSNLSRYSCFGVCCFWNYRGHSMLATHFNHDFSVPSSSIEPLKPVKIIVYGTLKQGCHNNRLLDRAKFQGPILVDGYKLYYSYSNKGFPVAAPDPKSTIEGELYLIEPEDTLTLKRLDALESEGFMYNRIDVYDDMQMYVGHPKCWDFDNLIECPKNDKNNYVWY